MTKLIQFVMSDRLNGHHLPDLFQVIIRCCDCCDTGTRETDLGSGTKFINHIRMSFLFTFHQDLDQIVLFVFI